MLAPSAATENIEGYNTSSTTIRVTWKFPPLAEQNGIIISYTVSYQAVGGSYRDGRKKHKQVTGISTQTDLTGLEEYVAYIISVSASTSAGEGPSSITIVVRTAEAGKRNNCHLVRLRLPLIETEKNKYALESRKRFLTLPGLGEGTRPSAVCFI